MAVHRWTGSLSSDLSNAGNWTGGVVPGSSDVGVFYGSGTLTGIASIGIVDFGRSTGSGFGVAADLTARYVADMGLVTLLNGAVVAAHVVDVGNAASGGTLQIFQASLDGLANGLELNVADGRVVLGGEGGSVRGTIALGQGTASIGGSVPGTELDVGTGVVTGSRMSSIVVGGGTSSGAIQVLGSEGTIALAGSLVVGSGTGGRGSVSLAYGGAIHLGTGNGLALEIGAGGYRSDGVLQGALALVTVDGGSVVGENTEGILALSASTLTTGSVVLGDASSGQGTLSLQGSRWSNAGSVVVGNAGVGTLALSGGGGAFSDSTIGGNLVVGNGGIGTVTVAGATLNVRGSASIGAPNTMRLDYASGVTVSAGARWNEAGQAIVLQPIGAIAGSTMVNTLDVTGAGSRLEAGSLSIGADSTAIVETGATMGFASATGTALVVDGGFVAASGALLTVSGATQVFGGIGAHGLSLIGGNAVLTAGSGPALTLFAGGLADVSFPQSTLTADGGISMLGGRLNLINGTVDASAVNGGLALGLSYGGTVTMSEATLNTGGLLEIDGNAPGPESLFVASGSSITSTASGNNPIAVVVRGQSTQAFVHLQATSWTVGGSFEISAGGTVLAEGGELAVSQILSIGSVGTLSALLSTAGTDTLVLAGTLSAGQTGISAGVLNLTGNNASIQTGALLVDAVGGFAAPLLINGGHVGVSGMATVESDITFLSGGGTLAVGTLTNGTGLGIITGSSGGLNIVTAGNIDAVGPQGMVFAGGLDVTAGSITGTGSVSFFAEGMGTTTLTLTGQAAASATIDFQTAGTIVTPSIADLASTVTGWQAGDAIDYAGTQIASFTYANTTLSLYDAGQHLLGTEQFVSTPFAPVTTSSFALLTDGSGGTFLVHH